MLDDSLLTCLRYERQEMLLSTPYEDSGDAQIDDSLSDDEDDVEVDADQTLKESEAETVKTGVLQEYLKEVLEHIKGQILTSKQPTCYKQGTFWIWPPDPLFALHVASVHGVVLSPTELYHLDIFVWLPQHLPGTPDTLRCTCGHKLIKHGWNNDPIARCVKHLDCNYFLLTNHMECPRPNSCGKTMQGTDPYVLA
jgi:hypothetical protein